MSKITTAIDPQVFSAQRAETKLRKTVLDGFFCQQSQIRIWRDCEKIIAEELKAITNQELMNAAMRSLRAFYRRQYGLLERKLGGGLLVYLALKTLRNGKENATEGFSSAASARKFLVAHGYDNVNLYGQPLKEYAEKYSKEKVVPVLDRLAEEVPLDPDDASGRKTRNSLRNRAEMEVRYQANQEGIAALKAQGVRLVIISSHADCSERCRPFQGRVFSLDGTSGYTDDGRRFEPIEVATDVYYTTKAGKTYKNGLFGFNCRHYAVPYKKGLQMPNPDLNEQRMQEAITKEQRRLERTVRSWEVKKLTYKGRDKKSYLAAEKKAAAWRQRYIDFCRANERPYFPNRIAII